MDRQMDKKIDRWTDRQTRKQSDGQTDRQKNSQMERQTDDMLRLQGHVCYLLNILMNFLPLAQSEVLNQPSGPT